MRDEVARFEDRFTLRCRPGKKMEVSDRYCARTLLALHVNGRLECGHCNVHIGRIRRDTVVTGAENRKCAVVTGDGGTARARLALVAWQRGVAEVHAPRSL